MTCKGCIHYEICPNKKKHHIVKNGFLFYFECEDIEKICSTFKDKSKILELTCKVGDEVYVICYKGNIEPYLRTETVLHMNYLRGKSLALWQIHTEYSVYRPKDVFYTKSEAEQKLKEMQNG